MSLSNLLKDLAPFCCMAFSECSVGSKSPWKLWPSWAPGISWPWQRSLVPVLCTLLNLNSTERKLATQPDSCCRSKKNTDLRWIYGESLWWISMVNLYGESMTILMGWWFSPLGSRRTPLDPTWWEAQVAMANCNSFIAIVSDLLFNFVQDWEMSRKYEMYNKLWMITGFKHKFVHPVPNQQRYFLGSWSAQTPIK